MSIKSFDELFAHLRAKKICKRVAVICPDDACTQESLRRAKEEGFIEPLPFHDADPATAATRAVEAVREGRADILMKGFINSAPFLHAIIDKEKGILPAGRVLTHIAVAEIQGYPRLLFFSDPAVIPFPTQEQRETQVDYLAHTCRRFGIEEPRIALIHCQEKADTRHFPYTAGYADIIFKAQAGEYGRCIVDGPLDVKTACSPEALAEKHIPSPIAGKADALVMPDIEAGNVFYKALTLFAQTRTAGLLQGTDVPVVMTSRADTVDSKYLSLCTACLL